VAFIKNQLPKILFKTCGAVLQQVIYSPEKLLALSVNLMRARLKSSVQYTAI